MEEDDGQAAAAAAAADDKFLQLELAFVVAAPTRCLSRLLETQFLFCLANSFVLVLAARLIALVSISTSAAAAQLQLQSQL